MSKTKCGVCGRDPDRMNSPVAECSHVDCPSRRHAWSERPRPQDFAQGPYRKNLDRDPVPVDRHIERGR